MTSYEVSVCNIVRTGKYTIPPLDGVLIAIAAAKNPMMGMYHALWISDAVVKVQMRIIIVVNAIKSTAQSRKNLVLFFR